MELRADSKLRIARLLADLAMGVPFVVVWEGGATWVEYAHPSVCGDARVCLMIQMLYL